MDEDVSVREWWDVCMGIVRVRDADDRDSDVAGGVLSRGGDASPRIELPCQVCARVLQEELICGGRWSMEESV